VGSGRSIGLEAMGTLVDLDLFNPARRD